MTEEIEVIGLEIEAKIASQIEAETAVTTNQTTEAETVLDSTIAMPNGIIIKETAAIKAAITEMITSETTMTEEAEATKVATIAVDKIDQAATNEIIAQALISKITAQDLINSKTTIDLTATDRTMIDPTVIDIAMTADHQTAILMIETTVVETLAAEMATVIEDSTTEDQAKTDTKIEDQVLAIEMTDLQVQETLMGQEMAVAQADRLQRDLLAIDQAVAVDLEATTLLHKVDLGAKMLLLQLAQVKVRSSKRTAEFQQMAS